MRRVGKQGWLQRAEGAGAQPVPGWASLESRARRILRGPWRDLVGVELGAHELHVAHLVRRGKRIVSLETASGTIAPEEAKSSGLRTAAQRSLRDAVLRLGLKGKPSAASLYGNEVILRRISLPLLKPAEILPALALECRKYVSFPIEDAEIRYEVVGRSAEPGAGGLQLLVAVAHRRAIDEARDTMRHAGLRPVSITVPPIGLRALLRSVGRTASDEVTAYLEMGARGSHIVVLRGEEIRFSREFGIGGDSLTEALRSIVVPGQGTIEQTKEEAENLKRAHGIPYGAEESGVAGSIPLASVSVMLRPVLERLVRELLSSFDYCNEQFLGEAVTRVVLLGEGSDVRNLPQYLTGILEIPVERADLCQQALGEPERRGAGAPQAARASDLAVGLCRLGRGSLNFLEPAGVGTAYRIAEAVPQRAAMAAAAVLLLSVSLPAEVTVIRERQQVSRLQGELVELEPRTEALRRFRAAREEETRLSELLARLSGGQVLWSYVLRDLSHRIGPDVRLTAIEVVDPPARSAAQPGTPPARRRLRFIGLLKTRAETPERELGELMQSLARSPVLDEVNLEGCQTVSRTLSTFTLSAALVE